MCLPTAALRAHPYRAFSLVEDLEYGIQLARGGIRVHYAAEATVASDMVSSSQAAASQRQRWERGRSQLSRQMAVPVLREALARRSLLLLDTGIDLLVPPLSSLALVLSAGLVAAFLAGAPTWPWLTGIAFVAIYVVRGWVLADPGVAGLRAVAWAPFYVVWKLFTVSRPGPREWVRTAREA
jgi:cellulose synthase/poly-beta-1,6-N-acetylglucosamine synthase-like glycosyltransferase